MKCHSTPSLTDPLTQMLQSHLAGSVSRLVQKLARRLSQDAQELKTANEKIARMEARIKFLEEKLGGDNKLSGEKTTPDLPAARAGSMDRPGDLTQGDSSLPEPDGVTDNGGEDYEMIDLTAHDDDVSPLPVVVAGGGEAEAELLLRQAVLVPHVKLLEGLAQHVLQEDRATSFTNIHRTSS